MVGAEAVQNLNVFVALVFYSTVYIIFSMNLSAIKISISYFANMQIQPTADLPILATTTPFVPICSEGSSVAAKVVTPVTDEQAVEVRILNVM